MELIFELLIEGMVEASGSSKIPLTVRLTLITIVFLPIAAIAIFMGFSLIDRMDIIGSVVSFIIALGALGLWGYILYLIIRNARSK
ncbi:hypothetical protein SDC9_139001 [bioreactor metagenome]|uniref:Uncharacterized protein n=1 Tax=bioreactor metagenome TaxID=1076179 RepID=A0A645DRB3_9ZZZZ